jgi:hypothetical protein
LEKAKEIKEGSVPRVIIDFLFYLQIETKKQATQLKKKEAQAINSHNYKFLLHQLLKPGFNPNA